MFPGVKLRYDAKKVAPTEIMEAKKGANGKANPLVNSCILD